MDPELDPEIRAAEANGELATPEIGGSDMLEGSRELIEAELQTLPAELQRGFNAIQPGLGDALLPQSQVVIEGLEEKLRGSGQVDGAQGYGTIREASAADNKNKPMSFGEIQQVVEGLKNLVEQLAQKVEGQQGETKKIDLDDLSGSDMLTVGVFWDILTGNDTFKPGDTTEVAGYEITASLTQGSDGIGQESPQVEIKSPEAAQEEELEAKSVMAAEDEPQPDGKPEDKREDEDDSDNPRKMPDTRYGRAA